MRPNLPFDVLRDAIQSCQRRGWAAQPKQLSAILGMSPQEIQRAMHHYARQGKLRLRRSESHLLYRAAMLVGMLLVPSCKANPAKVGHKSEQSPMRALAAPLPSSDTIRWADTTTWSRPGVDTTRFQRGRVITTAKVVVDSTWYRIALNDVVGGIPYGLTSIPDTSLCASGFNATVWGITADTTKRDSVLKATLDRAHACGARIYVRIARAKLRDSTGKLSVPTAVAEINSWPQWLGDHPAVAGFHLGDDPASADWGGTMASRLVKWDSIACAAKARWPKEPRILRARLVQMAMILPALPAGTTADTAWKCMTTGVSQWVVRLGEPNLFFQTEAKSAFRQKLGQLVAFNLLQGVSDTDPLPTTLIDSAGKAALKIPRACGFIPWAWPPAFPTTRAGPKYHLRPDVAASLKALGLAASVRPTASCIQR